ncbi:MAG: hypothetical protein ACJ79H_10805 [Myxococcales bacterium]
MRGTNPAILAVLALAAAGCPDSLERRCPASSLPSGNFQLALSLQHTADECVLNRSADGGPPPADGSIVPPAQSVQSTLCAGSSDAGATVYLVVANSDVLRQSPLDLDGGFTFVSPTLAGAQTLCGCPADVSETISGSLVGGGTTGFTLGPDGGLVPQPTEINAAVLQTLVSDAGNCLCNLPCAEHYALTGTLNR